MDPMKLLDLLRTMPLNRDTVGALIPMVGRVGTQGAIALARAYLGPVAREVEEKCCRELNQPNPCRDEIPPPPPPPPEPDPDPVPDPDPDPDPDPNTNPDPLLDPDPNADPDPDPADPPPPIVGTNDPRTGTSNTGFAGLHKCDIALLGMAVNKFLYEAGELALHNPDVRADGKLPQFKLDEHGSPPPLSLAHVVAGRRLWQDLLHRGARGAEEAGAFEPTSPRQRLQLARAQRYGAQNRFAYVPPNPLTRVPR